MVGGQGRAGSLTFERVSKASWIVLAFSLLAPLLIAVAWGDVYADAAYRQFQQAHLIATGQGWSPGASPLYAPLLALVDLLHLDLPSAALALSVIGWTGAIAAWFLVGLALGRPTFSTTAVILLALHPQQGRALGLESGLVLGLWGLTVWLAVQRRTRTALLTTILLSATQPLALSLVLPLLIIDHILLPRSGTKTVILSPSKDDGFANPSRKPLDYCPAGASIISTALGATCYALAIILSSDWHDLRLSVPLWAALDLLVAAGFAALTPHLDRRVLHRAIVVLSLAALVFWQGNGLIRDWRLRPTDRLALYEAIGQWLGENSLPSETVAAQQSGLIGYLSQRTAIPLPETARSSDRVTGLIAAIAETRPDHCIALNDLAWAGVRSSPWFQERYEPVHQLASPYDAATPLTVFRYSPTPFDAGEVISTTAVFGDPTGLIELTGYRLDSQRITPGEPLHLTLYWRANRRASAAIQQPARLSVRLVDPGNRRPWLHVENPAPGGVETDLWPVGTQVVDRYTLLPPVDIPPGDYVLDIAFHLPSGEVLPAALGDGETASTLSVIEETRLVLTALNHPPTISTVPLTPDHPLEATFGDEIELRGYDAQERITPGETLRVALYWHTLHAVPVDYKVFVHLLGPGDVPIAQDDGIPVGWTYPTASWQPGETIRDEHLLAIDPSTPRGDYRLIVGLYDPDTGERPAVHDAVGDEIVNRLVTLQQIQVR